jgi:hypothetical protein
MPLSRKRAYNEPCAPKPMIPSLTWSAMVLSPSSALLEPAHRAGTAGPDRYRPVSPT